MHYSRRCVNKRRNKVDFFKGTVSQDFEDVFIMNQYPLCPQIPDIPYFYNFRLISYSVFLTGVKDTGDKQIAGQKILNDINAD
jgi:hypothetical protein